MPAEHRWTANQAARPVDTCATSPLAKGRAEATLSGNIEPAFGMPE